jgi:hypothetical protein
MSTFLCLASIGRSGSTFLQRLLNTHPEIVLFGEHEGFLSGLRSAYDCLAAPRTVALIETGRPRLDAILGAKPVTDAPGGWSIEWTNAMRPADVGPAFGRFVEHLIYPPGVRSASHRYWGFKEIRYGAQELRFLQTIFPEGRVLMLARDPLAVYRSQCRLEWSREAGAEQAAADFHRAFSSLADAWDALKEPSGAGGRTQLVCYERLVADPLAHLDRIARWLGIAPFDQEKVLAVAAACMTPQRERWTPETQSFLDAYLDVHVQEDQRRYSAMVAGAIDVGKDRADPVAADRRPGGAAGARAGARRQLSSRAGPGRNRKLVFLNIPRTGVTTLHEQISKAFDRAEICPHRLGLPAECSAEELEGYRFFSGCFTPDEVRRIPGEKYVFTVLRDPVERLLSLRDSGLLPGSAGDAGPGSAGSPRVLSHQGVKGLRQILDNGMARQLAGSIAVTDDGTYLSEKDGVRTVLAPSEIVRLALTNLAGLDFVGFSDELDMAYARIAHDFGLPQAAGALPRRRASAATRSHAGPVMTNASLEAGPELSRLTELDEQICMHVRAAHSLPTAPCAAPHKIGMHPSRFGGGLPATTAIPPLHG